MTEQDRIIQDLRREIAALKKELDEIVRNCVACRYCARLDSDCTPDSADCAPEWRGLHER